MRKKVLICLVFVMGLLLLTGCEGSSKTITINGHRAKFNNEGTEKDIVYKYPDILDVEEKDQGVFLTYTKDDPRFRITVAYQDSDIEDTIKALAIEEEDTKVVINGIQWKKYNYEDEYGKYRIFAYEYKKTTYLISFVTKPNSDMDVDISDIMTKFIKNVSFK